MGFDFLGDVAEKHLVAGAEIVAALGNAKGDALYQAILGAASETEVGHIAMQTGGGQTVEFILAKLAIGLHHVVERALQDVADAILGKHIAVATIQVAILLNHTTMATYGFVYTQSGWAVGQVANGCLDYLHILAPHIATAPLVENGTEELAVGFGLNGEGRQVARLMAIDAWGQSHILSAIILRQTFYHWQKLHVVAESSQKLIHLGSMRGVGGIHGGEGIKLYAVFQQQVEPMHGATEGALAPCILAIDVVQMLGTVDADADTELMIAEELAPVVGEQRAVGLQRVQHVAVLAILLLQCHGALKEGDAAHGWLATMPGKLYLGISSVDIYHLTDIVLEHLIRHERRAGCMATTLR